MKALGKKQAIKL